MGQGEQSYPNNRSPETNSGDTIEPIDTTDSDARTSRTLRLSNVERAHLTQLSVCTIDGMLDQPNTTLVV
jgi:hypothetical protein